MREAHDDEMQPSDAVLVGDEEHSPDAVLVGDEEHSPDAVLVGDDEHSPDAVMADASLADDATPTSVLSLLRDWLPVLVIALIITVVVRFFIFQPYEIPSGSMEPTIVPGDRVIVNRLSYLGGELDRGQVVVFERPPSLSGTDDMIKRVVGLPGETVRFQNDAVYVGVLRMVEPYLPDGQTTRARTGITGCAESNIGANTCVVPEGHVFVLGDNRGVSTDSRTFGPIPIDTIIGRATLRVWPPGSINQL